MTCILLTERFPQGLYEESGLFPKTESKGYENIVDTAVSVEDSSIVLDPKQMNIGQYYLAVIDEAPYLYRRINDKEIEVYGMAQKD